VICYIAIDNKKIIKISKAYQEISILKYFTKQYVFVSQRTGIDVRQADTLGRLV
jgi:hypothetical protein